MILLAVARERDSQLRSGGSAISFDDTVIALALQLQGFWLPRNDTLSIFCRSGLCQVFRVLLLIFMTLMCPEQYFSCIVFLNSFN